MQTSHRYEVGARELFRAVAWPLGPVILLAAALHAGSRAGWLPPPRPALDTERTLLVHQVDAARRSPPVEVLLVGDSSCLTFSFLDLRAHARLIEEYNRAHATGPAVVVLLLHPEALRRLDSEPYYWRALTNYTAGLDDSLRVGWEGEVGWLSGRDLFHSRVLARALPVPLSGAYGRRYGFTRDLEGFLDREQGSVPDPENQPLRGSAEFRLAATLEKSCGVFRAALRPGTRLWVGLTPAPARFAGARFPAQQSQLLEQVGRWLRADALLDSLPATLPDEAFARTTHLKETEVGRYTDLLAAAMKERQSR